MSKFVLGKTSITDKFWRGGERRRLAAVSWLVMFWRGVRSYVKVRAGRDIYNNTSLVSFMEKLDLNNYLSQIFDNLYKVKY